MPSSLSFKKRLQVRFGAPRISQVEKRKMWEEGQRFRKQIAISLATLILTPIFSAIVVYFQLSQEHTFVNRQRMIALDQTRLNEKIRLQSEIAELIASSDTTRSKLASTEITATIDLNFVLSGDETYKESYDKSINESFDLMHELLDQYAKLQSLFLTTGLYFGPEVDQAIVDFEKYRAEVMLLPTKSLNEYQNTLFSSQKQGLTDTEVVTKEYELLQYIVNKDKYFELGRNLIYAMSEEISKEFSIFETGSP